MSLTSHLKSSASPIGNFIKQRFSQTANLKKEANQQLRHAETLRPSIAASGYPYTTIGMAIDYLLRYSFSITPYQRLVAWQGALLLTLKPLERDDEIPAEWDEIEIVLRRTGIPFDIRSGAARGPYPFSLIQAFFAALETTVKNLRPMERCLEADEVHTLARFCYVLALFEEVYRGGLKTVMPRSPLFTPTPKQNVQALLDIAQVAWIDDLSMLSTLFCTRYRSLFARPHILNPVFAGSTDIGGADADLIVDGCLIDIKTSVKASIESEFLYQLAGYLLLDYDDTFHITSLGIYMARQGMLFTWTVEEFLQQLTGEANISLSALRQAFQKICRSSQIF